MIIILYELLYVIFIIIIIFKKWNGVVISTETGNW